MGFSSSPRNCSAAILPGRGLFNYTGRTREEWLDDYTVIVYIEQNGNRQTELMRADDTAFFDDDHYQLEYVGTRADKEVFNVYHVKNYPSNGVIEVPQNVTEPVTSESVNTSAQSEPTIPFDNSNLMAIGALLLLVIVRKR